MWFTSALCVLEERMCEELPGVSWLPFPRLCSEPRLVRGGAGRWRGKPWKADAGNAVPQPLLAVLCGGDPLCLPRFVLREWVCSREPWNVLGVVTETSPAHSSINAAPCLFTERTPHLSLLIEMLMTADCLFVIDGFCYSVFLTTSVTFLRL